MPGFQSKKLATQRYADDVTLDHIIHLRKLANENEDLKAKIEQLREALRPFAEKFLWPDDSGYANELRMDEEWDEKFNEEAEDDVWVKRKWIRQARAALKEIE